MNRLTLTTLAALFACASTLGVACARENPGHHYGWQHNRHGQQNSCFTGPYYNSGNDRNYGRGHRDDENNDDNDGDRDGRNRGNNQYNNQYGYNGQYSNGQYGYGNNTPACAPGGYNTPSNGQYGQGSAVLRGEIVAVNGNQVTIRENGTYGYGGGPTMTINDQPALNSQTSGRVSVGRYVTAYGYWNNGVFYATQMN